MKHLFTSLLVLALCAAWSVSAAQTKKSKKNSTSQTAADKYRVPSGSFTDWEKARAKALKEGKPVFLFFTGSDWCSYCIRLKKEVFSNKKFTREAEKYVLLYVDFPRRFRLPTAQQKHNSELRSRFTVLSYPTAVIADAEGNELGRIVGYYPVSDYVLKMQDILDKHTKK